MLRHPGNFINMRASILFLIIFGYALDAYSQLGIQFESNIGYSNSMNIMDINKGNVYGHTGVFAYDLNQSFYYSLSEKHALGLEFGMTKFGHALKNVAGFDELPFSNTGEEFPVHHMSRNVFSYYKLGVDYTFSPHEKIQISTAFGMLGRIGELTYLITDFHFQAPQVYGSSETRQTYTTYNRRYNIYHSLSLRYRIYDNFMLQCKGMYVPRYFYRHGLPDVKVYHYSIMFGIVYRYDFW